MTVIFTNEAPSETVMLLRTGALEFLETGSTTKLRAVEEGITALEVENAALREFVRLVDDVVFLMAHREDGDRFHDARQRLATDHGLPLSGAREADDGNDEYGYCDMCGEPLIFASMCTCASCVHELHS